MRHELQPEKRYRYCPNMPRLTGRTNAIRLAFACRRAKMRPALAVARGSVRGRSSRSDDRIGTSGSFGGSEMAVGLPGFGRRFHVVGSLALSVTILASSLIFASRPRAGSGEEVREIFFTELPTSLEKR